MNDKLKPCPFCGGKAGISKMPPPILYKYRIVCGNPTCDLQPGTNWKQTKQEAIEVWNRRVNDERT